MNSPDPVSSDMIDLSAVLIDLSAVLINLGAVFLGALIAWISSISVHHRMSQAQKISELRSKLEVLVNACHEIPEWTQNQIEFFAFRKAPLRDMEKLLGPEAPAKNPQALLKIRTMQCMHFAKLDEQTRTLESAIVAFSVAVRRIAEKRSTSAAETIPQPSDAQEAMLTDMQKKVIDAQAELINAALKLNNVWTAEQAQIWTWRHWFTRKKS